MTRSLFDERPEWHDRAACKGLTHLFYPERGDPRPAMQAKAICATCPVRVQCDEAGRFERHGIWGRRSYTDRRRDTKRRRAVIDDVFSTLREGAA